MASSAGTDDARESDRLDPALRELIFVLLVGLAAVLLDTTIVNVALDRLAAALHTGTSTVQWVSTVFLLALGCAIPVSGWAVGRLGARTTWLLGLVLFLIGSVLAGSAWSIGALIAARAVQGLGGGLLLPVQQTLLVRAAGPARLGRAMAAIGLPAVVFPIFGPIVGGLILNDASWRWIFFINVPFAVAGIVLAARRLPADDPLRTRPRLDTTGLALFAPGTAAVLYALSQVAEDGRLTAPGAYLPLVAGLGLLAAFTVHALRGRVEPIIDVRLFARRSFSASCSLLFLTGLSLYGVALLLPLFYQQVRGQSALAAGLLLAPQGIGSLVARGSVGRLSDRFGPRPVVLVGVLLAAVGTLPYAWAGVHGQEALQAAGLVVRGIGLQGSTSRSWSRRIAACAPSRYRTRAARPGSCCRSAAPSASRRLRSCWRGNCPRTRWPGRRRPPGRSPSTGRSGGCWRSPCSRSSRRCFFRAGSADGPSPRGRGTTVV